MRSVVMKVECVFCTYPREGFCFLFEIRITRVIANSGNFGIQQLPW